MMASKQKALSKSSEKASTKTSSTRDTPAPQLQESPRVVAQRQTMTNVFGGPPPTASGSSSGATGLPTRLVNGIERLSGMNVSDVRVHENSAKPAQLGAVAIAQGNEIHLGPGQEKHLPHEAWHIVQQRQGRVKATLQAKGTGINDEPGLEREATLMGQRAMMEGSAMGSNVEKTSVQPSAAPMGTPVVQRKVFVDNRPTFASDSEEERQTKPNANWISVAESRAGDGARKISAMIADLKPRYFEDNAELTAYANKKTEDIGYVEREKTWVRLPDYLVLGETHTWTILPELVAAIGIKKYLYEADPEKSAYLHPRARDTGGEHALEAALPKYAMGLMALWDSINTPLHWSTKATRLSQDKGLTSTKPKKDEFKNDKKRTANAKVNAADGRDIIAAGDKTAEDNFKAKVTNWSEEWEQTNRTTEERHTARSKITLGSPGDLIQPYDRGRKEASYAIKALEALRSSTLPRSDALKAIYRAHSSVIDQTITQLKSGVKFTDTRLYLKIVTGKFDFEELIRQFQAAAEAERKGAGIENASSWKDAYGKTYEQTYTTDKGNTIEQLRDSHMLHRIIQGKAKGIRLFGLGDNHRQNLAGILAKEEPDITVTNAETWYHEQYEKHPDRD